MPNGFPFEVGEDSPEKPLNIIWDIACDLLFHRFALHLLASFVQLLDPPKKSPFLSIATLSKSGVKEEDRRKEGRESSSSDPIGLPRSFLLHRPSPLSGKEIVCQPLVSSDPSYQTSATHDDRRRHAQFPSRRL